MCVIIDHLPVVNPAQKEIVLAILLHQHLAHALCNGLHDDHRTVE